MNIYITTILIFVIAVIILIFRKKKAKSEDYRLLPSKSEETWFLGRRMNGHTNHPKNPDSKSFLENLGFRILGKEDEMRYAVEPPKGWNIIPYDKRLRFYVTDEKGQPKFWIFEKQELYEFKAYIYESEEMNALISKTSIAHA